MNGDLPRSYREDKPITRSNHANHVLSIQELVLLLTQHHIVEEVG